MPGISYAACATLLAGCALAAATMPFASVPARAGCSSGNTTPLLTSADCQATTNTSFDTAVGASAAARNGSTAVGLLASAKGYISTAIGRQATANEDGAIAIGHWAGYGLLGNGLFSTSIGAGTSGGTSARAGGTMAVAVGGGDSSEFTPAGGTLMYLNGASAPGLFGVAMGVASQAKGAGGTAVGFGSQATANDSAAFGDLSLASGNGSVAAGVFSQATANFAIAFGRLARATKQGAVALGYNSLASELNVVSVGNPNVKRRIVNVGNGVNPNDAVTVAQLTMALASMRATMEQQQREIAELKAAVKRN